MHIVWGIVVAVLSLVAWGGQTVTWLKARLGRRPAPSQPQGGVEMAHLLGIRGEAPFDTVTLWTMVVAGVLLVVDNGAWAYFGLVGGGMYVYFAGRALFTSVAGHRESQSTTSLGYALLVVWAIMGLITIAAAVVALPIA
jgi:hypothetical protein